MVTNWKIWANIGSSNGLLPDGTKPLPEPVLTYYQRCSVAFTWEQFLKKCWKEVRKMSSNITPLKLQPHCPRVQWVLSGVCGSITPSDVVDAVLLWTNCSDAMATDQLDNMLINAVWGETRCSLSIRLCFLSPLKCFYMYKKKKKERKKRNNACMIMMMHCGGWLLISVSLALSYLFVMI